MNVVAKLLLLLWLNGMRNWGAWDWLPTYYFCRVTRRVWNRRERKFKCGRQLERQPWKRQSDKGNDSGSLTNIAVSFKAYLIGSVLRNGGWRSGLGCWKKIFDAWIEKQKPRS
jgi:hypothetical protein